jgi:histidinol-phosphate aminotransferase
MRMNENVNDWVHNIAPYQPGRTIDGMIKLASNENAYGPSPLVIKGLREAIPNIGRYPYKDNEVKEAIAAYAKVKPENIILGNGSDENIELVIKAYRGSVASSYPSFVSYPIYAQMHNRQFLYSSLNPDFTFNREKFIKDTWNANILFLCTPNNPTGMTIDISDIEDIAQTGKIVVVDEAYFEFNGVTAKNLVLQYPNVIVMRTLAKAFALAGLRIGYAIAHEEVAQTLSKVKGPFNVNILAQEAALLALKDLEYMKRCVSRIIQDRKSIETRLVRKFKVFPSQANFLLVDVSPYTSQQFFEKMLDNKIVTRPQPKFHGFEGNYVRITIGTTEENYQLAEAIDRI